MADGSRRTLLGILAAVMLLPSIVLAEVPSTSQVVLKAKYQAVLSSQLPGQIESIPVAEGDAFKKDQALVIFDCTTHAAQKEKAQAQFEAKQIAHNSNIRLQKAKAVSLTDLAKSKAELADARASLTIKEHTVRMCKVIAPFDGRLVKRHIRPHETVRQGVPLVEVLDNSELNIELIVPSTWLAWLKKDEPFKLYIEETGLEYRAHITKILPRVDAVSQSIRVLGKLDHKYKELISGMSGHASFHKQKSK